MARATIFVRTTDTNGTRLLAYAATIAAFAEPLAALRFAA